MRRWPRQARPRRRKSASSSRCMATSRCSRRRWPASARQDYPALAGGVRRAGRGRCCASGRPPAAGAVSRVRHRRDRRSDAARAKPQGGQPDQHAAGGEARRAGDRRFRPARGAGLPAAARGGAAGSREPGWSPRSTPGLPAPREPAGAARSHADQPLLPPGCAAGTSDGSAGLPRGDDGAATGDAGTHRRPAARWWTIWPTTMCSGGWCRRLGLQVRAGGYRAGHHRAGDHLSQRCGATSCAGRGRSGHWCRSNSQHRSCSIRWYGRR